ELHKYISGIVQNRKQKMLSIFCLPDHTHLFVGLKPDIAVSDLVRDVKAGKFNWQEGFGAFSYSKSQMDDVVNYILNQEDHHKKRTFNEEYLDFLKKF